MSATAPELPRLLTATEAMHVLRVGRSTLTRLQMHGETAAQFRERTVYRLNRDRPGMEWLRELEDDDESASS